MAATHRYEEAFEAEGGAMGHDHGLASADGRFVLWAKLGEGRHAKVYRALDTKYGRCVALKLVRRDGEGLQALRHEVEVRRSLPNPSCIVPAYGVYDIELASQWFVALSMECAVGGSLCKWIHHHRRNHGHRLREGITLFGGLCDAVAGLHQGGFIHADLKPANVLLGACGPILADLASAVPFDPRSRLATNSAYTVFTTPAYTAPEIWRGEDPGRAGPRVDCYALGCIGYELFGRECRPPFSGGMDRQRNGHLYETPARLEGVPEHIWRVIQRCLEKR